MSEPKENVNLTKFTGTEVGYYFICRKKLWWFHNGVEMEQEHDRVKLGKLVHETSYGRKKKEISIDGKIVLDWNEDGVIHEVKLTNKMESAHEYQLLYYLFYLRQKGIENLTGQIDYPKMKQTQKIELTDKKETKLIEALEDMEKIISSKTAPEVEYMPICKSCSYAELCWS